ncbi:MAG TPA: FxLYD domain-containing protein [Candidatus Dormibacteraeota bacterium]|nr:FxLYD domain-containing protein [Candidatus Dormibacteraeota bacterium]
MNSMGGFDREDKSRFPAAFVVGLVIVALVVLVVVLATHSTHPTQLGHQSKLPFDAAAQSYAPNIHFQKLELAESSNLLNQKFTYVNGIIANDGSRAIKALEIKVEFHDPFDQVILRETHRVISASDNPLAAGQQRAFNLTFDGVPVEWNRQNPTIQVTGLVLR